MELNKRGNEGIREKLRFAEPMTGSFKATLKAHSIRLNERNTESTPEFEQKSRPHSDYTQLAKMKTYLLISLFWVSHACANSYMRPPIFIQTDTETQVLEAVLEKYDSITKAITETLPSNSEFLLELDYDADLKIYTYTISAHAEISEEQFTGINQSVSRYAIDSAMARVEAMSKDLTQFDTKQPDKNPTRDELVQKILRRRLQNCNYYSGYSWLLKINPQK